jgi:hypothetical protein
MAFDSYDAIQFDVECQLHEAAPAVEGQRNVIHEMNFRVAGEIEKADNVTTAALAFAGIVPGISPNRLGATRHTDFCFDMLDDAGVGDPNLLSDLSAGTSDGVCPRRSRDRRQSDKREKEEMPHR